MERQVFVNGLIMSHQEHCGHENTRGEKRWGKKWMPLSCTGREIGLSKGRPVTEGPRLQAEQGQQVRYLPTFVQITLITGPNCGTPEAYKCLSGQERGEGVEGDKN